MDANQRRAAVAEYIARAGQPVSAGALAGVFSVSRQVIVGDIALLRAAGAQISATPRGYMLPHEHSGMEYKVACVHAPEAMERELEIMVDNGCTVVDVVVDHPLYGQLTGPLNLSSRYDVQKFVEKTNAGHAKPLADLTWGIHLHTVRCPDQQAYERVCRQLDEAGFLYRTP